MTLFGGFEFVRGIPIPFHAVPGRFLSFSIVT